MGKARFAYVVSIVVLQLVFAVAQPIPVYPDTDRALKDPIVRAGVERMWTDSQAGTLSSHEEGGWILVYLDPSGIEQFFIVRWAAGSTCPPDPQPGSCAITAYNPTASHETNFRVDEWPVPNAERRFGPVQLVAHVHTHPISGYEKDAEGNFVVDGLGLLVPTGYLPYGPSDPDVNSGINNYVRTRVPGLVRHEFGLELFGCAGPLSSECEDDPWRDGGIGEGHESDADSDGILDQLEGRASGGFNHRDSDSDGISDYLDYDSDNDGIPDAGERGPNRHDPSSADGDGDGIPAYADPDPEDCMRSNYYGCEPPGLNEFSDPGAAPGTIPPPHSDDESGSFDQGVASTHGDPHIRSFDDLALGVQSVGEFVLVRSTSDSFEIQARFAEVASDLSGNAAVAMNVAGDQVGLYTGDSAPPQLFVNHELVELGDEMEFDDPDLGYYSGYVYSIELPHGGTVSLRGRDAVVVWPDESRVEVTLMATSGSRQADLVGAIKVTVPPERWGRLEGLLGNFNNDWRDDVRTREGRILIQPSVSDVHSVFAESWRLWPHESLFDYGPGENSETFTDYAAPRAYWLVDALDPLVREEAEAICRQQGVVDPRFLRDCTLDVAATGDASYAILTAGLDPNTRGVAILPVAFRIPADGSRVLGAVVSGPSSDDAVVRWSVEGGAIDAERRSATFTAPSEPGLYSVTAYLADDPAVRSVATAIVVRATTGTIVEASTPSGGGKSDGASNGSSVALDGSIVTFNSRATNLVPGGTSGSNNVFSYNRETGELNLVTASATGTPADRGGNWGVVSGSGRYAVFSSTSTNLDTRITSPYEPSQVYLKDLLYGDVDLVSVGPSGAPANGSSGGLPGKSISDDGRLVLFTSEATNLLPASTSQSPFQENLYLADVAARSIRRVNEHADGTVVGPVNDDRVALTPDGRFAAFAAGPNWNLQVYRKDLATDDLVLISASSSGEASNSSSSGVSLSADGRYAVFTTRASNLTQGSDGGLDVYRKDLSTGAVHLLSDNGGEDPAISHDGRYVVFSSYDSLLVADDSNGRSDVFVLDVDAWVYELVSRGPSGEPATNDSYDPQISGNGEYIVFDSWASDLTTDQTDNGRKDTFIAPNPLWVP